MRPLLSLLLALIFCGAPLASADLNATIVHGTVETYESLLAKLKKSGRHDDETSLQEALLYKLINLSKNPPPQSLNTRPPSDEKSYRALVKEYGQWSLQKAKILENLDALDEKLDAVNEQLRSSDGNASDAMTLQLQEAFYRKGKILYLRKLHLYEAAMADAPKLFADALASIELDPEQARKRIEAIDAALEKLKKERQQLDVEQERLNLLGRSEEAKRVARRIERLETQKKKLLNEKMSELFILFSEALRQKKSEEAFALQKEMMQIVKKFYPPGVQKDLENLLVNMETLVLGRAETIRGATLEEIKSAAALFWQKVNAPLFRINKTPISAFKLFVALLIFLIGVFVGGFYKASIKRITFTNRAFTSSTRTLVANLGYYLIIIVAFFIALNVLGINLSSIALVAGALSVGIGFGLQNIVSNFVSGIILMFERSIKIGDYIEFDENLRGHVSDIRMRSTTITTNDNIDVIVPNQDLIQNRVINWTMNDRIRRFRIPFGVAYGTDVHRVVEVVNDALAQSGFADIYSDARRHNRVIMTGMGDSSVDFELLVWIRGEEILYPRRTTSRFLMLIYDALYEAGIEIPFPQRDIHIRSVDGEIPLRLENTAKHPPAQERKTP